MKRHPNNATGPFWIDQDVCMICASCFEIAPNNIKAYDDVHLSYVFKQPQNDTELEAVRKAILHCPVEAVVEDK